MAEEKLYDPAEPVSLQRIPGLFEALGAKIQHRSLGSDWSRLHALVCRQQAWEVEATQGYHFVELA